MTAESLKGTLLGALPFYVLPLFKDPFSYTPTKQVTTKGGILSKVVDVVGRETREGSELMLGLADEAGTVYVKYQPGLFYAGKVSVPVVIDQSEIDRLAKENGILSKLGVQLKKYVLIAAAIGAIAFFVKRK